MNATSTSETDRRPNIESALQAALGGNPLLMRLLDLQTGGPGQFSITAAPAEVTRWGVRYHPCSDRIVFNGAVLETFEGSFPVDGATTGHLIHWFREHGEVVTNSTVDAGEANDGDGPAEEEEDPPIPTPQVEPIAPETRVVDTVEALPYDPRRQEREASLESAASAVVEAALEPVREAMLAAAREHILNGVAPKRAAEYLGRSFVIDGESRQARVRRQKRQAKLKRK